MDRQRIAVIGVGPGREDLLTLRARQLMNAADCIYAAKRHGVLAEGYLPLEPLAAALERIQCDYEAGRRIAVLVSGDPGLFSMLGMLERRFGADALEVVPGVSALQALCARLGVSWQDARILSGHGRALSEAALANAARTNPSVILFCDAQHGPIWIAETLKQSGLNHVRISVGERLSYPDERITTGTPMEISGGNYAGLCMVHIQNPKQEAFNLPIGIADEAFIRGKTPMTKREIRALCITQLQLQPDSIVWDVGAGTGSVSIECARQCYAGRVYAIERHGDAVELIRQNAEKFHTLNLAVVQGHAPEALQDLPVPNRVFLGGSGGEMQQILRLLEGFQSPVRLVATAVTLESLNQLMENLQGWKNLEAVQLGVTRLEKTGAYHMFRAQNPIFILSADWEGNQ